MRRRDHEEGQEGPEFLTLAALDRLVHEPVRLVVLTALLETRRANFTFLKNVTGATAGNLGSHLTTLEEHGLVVSERGPEQGKTVTFLRLTPRGRKAVRAYWSRMEAVGRGLRG